MPSARGSKCKGKAAIPKLARGLGLNPSGLPAADQLNLNAEQPQMVPFDFDPLSCMAHLATRLFLKPPNIKQADSTQVLRWPPKRKGDMNHETHFMNPRAHTCQNMYKLHTQYFETTRPLSNKTPYGPSVGGQQDAQQQLFENAEGSSFGHMQGQAPAQGHMQGQALAHEQLPYDNTQGSLYYGDGQGLIPYGDGEGSMSYEAGPSLFSHTQGLSYGDGGGDLYGDGEAGPSSFSHAQDSSGRDDHNTLLYTDEEGHDFYDHFRDISFNSGPLFADFSPDHPGQMVPVPQWIEEESDRGTSITDQGGGGGGGCHPQLQI
ncbi:hypothetical protein DFJ58DRAFT_835535 [Suillus subalutaceus]|uniref:uncharacterized protein n=1 Tax=Suillus subalutaceus TaxID=48586 RepID=UPI001B878FE4|nr:uncharacterized protein DFJ58DRAFT_835535 [Suillus subalutaceus]KAG1877842.1 hypothetical protein DFJ58DRAFT_835535 [Suillus subalutaceus]